MTTTLTTRQPLTRRIPDVDGELVTYLPMGALTALVGISTTAVGCWTRQGLVRHTDRLSGSRNYAVVDCAKLKLMTRKDCQELGIQKTPEAHLQQKHRWYEQEQAETRKRADYHGEIWDDYDLAFVVSNLAEGRSLDSIAKTLGRTYAAVTNVIERMRDSGDLDRPERDEDEWKVRTIAILTPIEVASLLTREKAV